MDAEQIDHKMVIVARHDLHMRLGKAMSQAGHAVEMFLWDIIEQKKTPSPDQWLWFKNGRKKVTLRVNSREELLELLDKARSAGLATHLVVDSGKTEFHSQPTETCFTIGPHASDVIDAITGHLKLL